MTQTVRTRSLDTEVSEHRDPDHDVDPLFVNRWSARAMTGDTLAPEEFLPLFEAARWAPSAYNNQHWRFLYATRDDEEWETFFDLLNEANQTWASEAGVLVVILAKTTFDHNGESAPTHSFDTGAAWQNLALEATRRDLVAHPMAGFDWGRVHGALDVPEDEFDVEAMVAIGERGDPESLPEDLQEREFPKGRKSLDEITFNGRFE
jgi:nitroreductase